MNENQTSPTTTSAQPTIQLTTVSKHVNKYEHENGRKSGYAAEVAISDSTCSETRHMRRVRGTEDLYIGFGHNGATVMIYEIPRDKNTEFYPHAHVFERLAVNHNTIAIIASRRNLQKARSLATSAIEATKDAGRDKARDFAHAEIVSGIEKPEDKLFRLVGSLLGAKIDMDTMLLSNLDVLTEEIITSETKIALRDFFKSQVDQKPPSRSSIRPPKVRRNFSENGDKGADSQKNNKQNKRDKKNTGSGKNQGGGKKGKAGKKGGK